MTDAVLLTGATGFVGRAVLAALLAQGIRVHAVGRKVGAAQDGVIWHSADLLTAAGRAAVAGLAPRLIHCAWDVTHGAFWSSPSNALWQNASLDLVRRFRAAGCGKVLAVGTCAEYDAQAIGPWDETRPIAPVTAYGQAKAALHRDLTELCGEDLIWARLFHLFGTGEDLRRFVPSIITALRQNQPAKVRAAHLIRDYASTAHVAGSLVALLNSNVTGACNIGSGQPRSLGDLASIIAACLDQTHLLDFGQTVDGQEPIFMAPDLVRLTQAVTFEPENTIFAMKHYIAAITPTAA